jgi:hypothetical protein
MVFSGRYEVKRNLCTAGSDRSWPLNMECGKDNFTNDQEPELYLNACETFAVSLTYDMRLLGHLGSQWPPSPKQCDQGLPAVSVDAVSSVRPPG